MQRSLVVNFWYLKVNLGCTFWIKDWQEWFTRRLIMAKRRWKLSRNAKYVPYYNLFDKYLNIRGDERDIDGTTYLR